MEWVQGMNEAVNYIEEHILEEPDLNELGKLAGCSAHHFQRIFTYIGGITLTEYLRKKMQFEWLGKRYRLDQPWRRTSRLRQSSGLTVQRMEQLRDLQA